MVLLQNSETNEIAAAKIFSQGAETKNALAEREASLHRTLKHENIIEFKDFQKNLTIEDAEGNQEQVTAMLLEYAAKGDLFDLIENFNSMPLFLARSFAKQVVEAIAYLHERGIAHRDIKLENFLLDAKYRVKLADFGLSCHTDKDELLTEANGTLQYQAPEQHAKKPYNGFQVDVFSLGVVIFLLVAGRMPFLKADSEDEYYKDFVTGDVEKFWEKQEELVDYPSEKAFFQKDFRDLMNGMLCYKPEDRFTIKDVVSHPWMTVSSLPFDKCSEIVAEVFKKKALKP